MKITIKNNNNNSSYNNNLNKKQIVKYLMTQINKVQCKTPATLK